MLPEPYASSDSAPTRLHAIGCGSRWSGSHLTARGCIGLPRGRGLVRVISLLCSLACSDGEGVAPDNAISTFEVGASQQALGYPSNGELRWPNGTVPYCYQPSAPISGHPQPGTPLFNQTIDMIERFIAEYETVPHAHIDFQGGALCPDWDDYIIGGDPDVLRILITTDDAATRSCDPGSIAQGESFENYCGGFNVTKETLIAFGKDHGEAAALHELAHALWFRHEYLRRSDGCNPSATTPVDNGITGYDFYSVTNATWCHWRAELSALDRVGLAFVYPGATADQLTIPYSFRLPNTVVLTRQDNAVIEFAQRVAGVEAHHYSGAQWWKFVAPNFTQIATGSSVTLATLLGSSSQAILRGQFTDFVGRVRTTPNTTFRRDPGSFSALVLSAAPLF
jgi:hypothetical protein